MRSSPPRGRDDAFPSLSLSSFSHFSSRGTVPVPYPSGGRGVTAEVLPHPNPPTQPGRLAFQTAAARRDGTSRVNHNPSGLGVGVEQQRPRGLERYAIHDREGTRSLVNSNSTQRNASAKKNVDATQTQTQPSLLAPRKEKTTLAVKFSPPPRSRSRRGHGQGGWALQIVLFCGSIAAGRHHRSTDVGGSRRRHAHPGIALLSSRIAALGGP